MDGKCLTDKRKILLDAPILQMLVLILPSSLAAA
jgi:hypothetical protein